MKQLVILKQLVIFLGQTYLRTKYDLINCLANRNQVKSSRNDNNNSYSNFLYNRIKNN